MMKLCQKINLQEPQRNRNATANYVNLIMTSTVTRLLIKKVLEILSLSYGLLYTSNLFHLSTVSLPVRNM